MPSEWAYEIAREQRRDVETMATNLDAARARGRREGLEEAAKIAAEACDVIANGMYYDSCRPRTFADVAAEIRARIEEQA